MFCYFFITAKRKRAPCEYVKAENESKVRSGDDKCSSPPSPAQPNRGLHDQITVLTLTPISCLRCPRCLHITRVHALYTSLCAHARTAAVTPGRYARRHLGCGSVCGLSSVRMKRCARPHAASSVHRTPPTWMGSAGRAWMHNAAGVAGLQGGGALGLVRGSGCNPVHPGDNPVHPGCNPLCSQAATRCASRLQPHASRLQPYVSRQQPNVSGPAMSSSWSYCG